MLYPLHELIDGVRLYYEVDYQSLLELLCICDGRRFDVEAGLVEILEIKHLQ
jgi:hypothetical protein